MAGGRTKQALIRGMLQTSKLGEGLTGMQELTRRIHSLPIRLHHPLWLVRHVPLHANR